MNRVESTPCKPTQIDYPFKKNFISHCEKKCLAFRDSVPDYIKHENRGKKKNAWYIEDVLEIMRHLR